MSSLSFPELIASRREWIDETLKPWCLTASRFELLQAEQAWVDLAGRPDPGQTLWYWAWSRFPELCDEELTGLNEAWQVAVTLKSGETVTGYPDARQSRHGELTLVESTSTEHGPYSIDDIVSAVRVN